MSNLIGYSAIALFASGTSNASQGIVQVGMEWFLMCLFVARLIFNQIMGLFERTAARPLVLQAFVFGLLMFVGIFLGAGNGLYLPFSLDVAFVAVGFMWCGYMMKEFSIVERFARRWYAIAIALVIFLVAITVPDAPISMAGRLYSWPLVQVFGALAGSFLIIVAAVVFDGHRVSLIGLLCRYLSFMGRNTMLVFCFHCLDWYIPWSALPAFAGLRGGVYLSALVRLGYNSVCAYLARKV